MVNNPGVHSFFEGYASSKCTIDPWWWSDYHFWCADPKTNHCQLIKYPCRLCEIIIWLICMYIYVYKKLYMIIHVCNISWTHICVFLSIYIYIYIVIVFNHMLSHSPCSWWNYDICWQHSCCCSAPYPAEPHVLLKWTFLLVLVSADIVKPHFWGFISTFCWLGFTEDAFDIYLIDFMFSDSEANPAFMEWKRE